MIVFETSCKAFQVDIKKRGLEDVPEEAVTGYGRISYQVYQVTLGVPGTGKAADAEFMQQAVRILDDPKPLRGRREDLVPFE
jgi:hypothetical protein